MMLSECCGALPWGDMEEMGICGDCKDHCEFYDDDEEAPKERGEFSGAQQAIIDNIMADGEGREG